MSRLSTEDPDLERLLTAAARRELPALIEAWADATDERRWIARALRLDLAVLTDDPSLALPCVYRRCAWPGTAAEVNFYSSRPPVPPELAALPARVARWTAAWTPQQPWLRALRPPLLPLDAPVVEEYRCAYGSLRFDESGAAIGVFSRDGAAAWDRASGRRIDADHVAWAKTPTPRWREARNSSWGLLAVDDGAGNRVTFALEPDDIVRDLCELHDGDVIATADWCGEDEARYRLCPSTGTIRWRQWGAARNAVLRSDGNLLAASGDAIVLIDGATGQTRGHWSMPGIGGLVVLPGGDHAATFSNGVVRIWDIARALATPPIEPRVGRSWIDVAFSPSGRRVITGNLLCNGDTGEPITALGCNSPGWLEGGPPDRCQLLGDETFVEIIPFGLRVWSSRDGRLLHEDRDQRLDHRDLVAFDPTGRFYAAAMHHPRLLELRRLPDGAKLLSEPSAVVALAMSRDGERFAWLTEGGELWVLTTAAPVERRRIATGVSIDSAIGWGPDGEPTASPPVRQLVATSNGMIAVTAADGAIVRFPDDHGAPIMSPSRDRVATRLGHYAVVLPR